MQETAATLQGGIAETALQQSFAEIRRTSVSRIDGLSAEDASAQSMPDASPTKWHLAHTTWFFEQFVLDRLPGHEPYDARWHFLFNSYYQSVGPMHARPQRGLLTRPSLDEVLAYREAVDAQVQHLLASGEGDEETAALVTLGLHHEQQHQELMLTDIKHLLSCNPLQPAYRPAAMGGVRATAQPLQFVPGLSGIQRIGHGSGAFAFDCETPRHEVFLRPHAIASRPVSNAEFRAFIDDGGYQQPMLWMAEGWNIVQEQGWQRPLYWSEDLQHSFTLSGLQPLLPDAPACHLSFFEADAFARWYGARLPTEAEWECMAADRAVRGNFYENGLLQPAVANSRDATVQQLFGDVWEWTASPYVQYPGFQPLPGSLGEYNGKFMCGQYVLRGGSCVTPHSHMRATYRNFFYPADRWQFSGLRLAKDL